MTDTRPPYLGEYADPQPVAVDVAGDEERPHILSKDCWCNPTVDVIAGGTTLAEVLRVALSRTTPGPGSSHLIPDDDVERLRAALERVPEPDEYVYTKDEYDALAEALRAIVYWTTATTEDRALYMMRGDAVENVRNIATAALAAAGVPDRKAANE